MTQKLQTFFIDDLDGSEAEGTVLFGLDGTHYEIDLSTGHAKELRTALARYIDAGRRVTGTARRAGDRAQGPRERHQQHRGARLGQGAGD
jgi:hypothetical protein